MMQINNVYEWHDFDLCEKVIHLKLSLFNDKLESINDNHNEITFNQNDEVTSRIMYEIFEKYLVSLSNDNKKLFFQKLVNEMQK